MGVFQLGDYTVQNLNQGWRISWQTGSVRHHLDIDLEQILRQYIFDQLESLIYIVNKFEKGPEEILNDPMGFLIIKNMPDSDTIPGSHLQPHQIKDWQREQIIKGYNRVNNTNFTYDMVRNRLP